MALSESDKRDFVRRIVEILIANTNRLSDTGFHPASLITALQDKAQAVQEAEQIKDQVRENSLIATRASNEKLDDVYHAASSAVDLIVGLVGKESELAHVLHSIRGEYSQSSTQEDGSG